MSSSVANLEADSRTVASAAAGECVDDIVVLDTELRYAAVDLDALGFLSGFDLSAGGGCKY
jgi:hypothetical protein